MWVGRAKLVQYATIIFLVIILPVPLVRGGLLFFRMTKLHNISAMPDNIIFPQNFNIMRRTGQHVMVFI